VSTRINAASRRVLVIVPMVILAVSAIAAAGAAGSAVRIGGGLVYWGAFIDGNDTYSHYYGGHWGDAPWDAKTWHRFESNAGKKVSIVHWGLGTPWDHDFNAFRSTFNLVRRAGELSLVDMTTGTVSLRAIADGRYDAKLRAWAHQAAAWGHPFMLTLDVEMNGNWEPYGTAPPARNKPADFVAAWRHFHRIADRAGASNITWVWVPNVDPYHRFTPYDQLYPGDAYVDWTGLDGFNWGGSDWMTFSQLYEISYHDLLTLAPSKPIMISQIGSAERGGSKASWITDVLSTQLPQNYPRIKALIWFNWRIYQKKAWSQWPIESSGTARSAFAAAIASPYYTPGGALGDLPLGTKIASPDELPETG
jgi:hypothetical protein